MTKYFFRLDDIAPNMNWNNFFLVKNIFKRYGIKPLFAIIPDLKDPKLLDFEFNSDFWNVAQELSADGWIAGQHGYQHLSSGDGGILHIHSNGEFGKLNFGEQKKMICLGKEIMLKNSFSPNVFIAPRHSFDRDTIKALKENDFNFISDGIALFPFKKWDIIWLPQILWRPRKGLFGKVTVALHLNTMTDADFENLEKFIKENQNKIGNFSELMDWYTQSYTIKKMATFFINLAFKMIWWPIFWTKFRISK